jgi:hypothetical protein
MKKLLLFLAAISAHFFAQIPTNGLVGAWIFNGNANDITGNNNNGMVYGASLVPDRCGNLNSAYSFDGVNDYIQLLTTGPTGTVSRSLSFWTRSTSTALSPMVAFDYGASTGNGDVFQMVFNYSCPGVGIDVSNQALIRGNKCLMNGVWHHIAAVYNASLSTQINSVVFYIDGVVQPSISCFITGTNGNINTSSANPITIGKHIFDMGRFFDGSLDDFYLYNRPLTSAEVQQLYSVCLPVISGITTVCPGVSYIYGVTPVSGIASYSWSFPGGWTGSSTTNTISLTAGTNIGAISVAFIPATGSVSCAGNTAISVFKDVCTGFDENVSNNLFTCYPNPSTGKFIINSGGPSLYEVIDCFGQWINSGTLAGSKTEVDLESYAPGVYFIRVNASNRTQVLKLIIQK